MKQHRLLVANRGEIAVRIIRAASQLNIETVAIFEPIDRDSLHCRLASIPIELPEGGYLNQNLIVDIAQKTKSTLIHPGYGFLAENADFATAISNAGIEFVGPSIEAIRQMGDKISARARMMSAGVPVVPGIESVDLRLLSHTDKMSENIRNDRNVLQKNLAAIGYPVMVKASAGGGGKGMRLVNTWDDFTTSAASAAREAARAFSNDSIYVEKFVQNPKHIEVQVFGTNKGVFHLGERECSIQRRHQKVIEECPSPSLSQTERHTICKDAVSAAAAINYQNAGTVEFLFDSKTRQHYFLEMNTRLQVEHPITEWCTGIDLVQLQILQAIDQFPSDFAEPSFVGHAIECRVYAENPTTFAPSPGKVQSCIFPHGPGVRVDTAITGPTIIPDSFDPQVAKISCWGNTRTESIHRMIQALKETRLEGLTHNVSFLLRCLRHKVFLNGDYDTAFVEKYAEELLLKTKDLHSNDKHQNLQIGDTAAIAFALSRIGIR